MVEEDPLASLRLTMQLAGKRAWVAWFRGPEHAVADLLQGLEEAADEPVVCIPTVFELSAVPAGSLVLAGVDDHGAVWLNAHRSAIQANQLRLVLWQPDSAAFSLRTIAPDLDSWIGTWGRFPEALPEVVRSALRRGASTMAMVRGIPTPTLAAALGEDTALHTRKPMADPSLPLPAGLVVYQPIETDWQLRRALRQLAWHGRNSGALFATSSSWQSGLPLVDATTIAWAEATEQLRAAGVQDAARCAARLGCLAQAIDESVAAVTSGGEAPATVAHPLDEVERSLWALPRNGDTAAQWLAFLRDPSLIAEESPFVVALCNQLLAADPAPASDIADALHALRIESLIADSQTSTVCPSTELPEALVPMLEAPDSLDRVICLVGWVHAAVDELREGLALSAVAAVLEEFSERPDSVESALATWGLARVGVLRSSRGDAAFAFDSLRVTTASGWVLPLERPVLETILKLFSVLAALEASDPGVEASAELDELAAERAERWPRAHGVAVALAAAFESDVRISSGLELAAGALAALGVERAVGDAGWGCALSETAWLSFAVGNVAVARELLTNVALPGEDALVDAPFWVLQANQTKARLWAEDTQQMEPASRLWTSLLRAYEQRCGRGHWLWLWALYHEAMTWLRVDPDRARPLLETLRCTLRSNDIGRVEPVDAYEMQRDVDGVLAELLTES